MLCVSPTTTCEVIEHLTKQYDIPVTQWSSNLIEIFKVTSELATIYGHVLILLCRMMEI